MNLEQSELLLKKTGQSRTKKTIEEQKIADETMMRQMISEQSISGYKNIEQQSVEYMINDQIISDYIVDYEEVGIGIRNESNLHYGLKKWYAKPGDRFEVKVGGNIIDMVRGNTLIEIQTKNFSAMKNKLHKLIDNYQVIVVHPVAIEKWILTTNKEGEVLRRRKSTKKGRITDIFDELVSIPDLINNENFSLDIIFIHEEELRCDNGKGSWRRKGVSIINKNLICVESKKSFRTKYDFLEFIPHELNEEFTNKELAKALGISPATSRKITYCLKKMELIKECGKRSRELLFKKSEQME
jgi:hypothetical protein